MKILILVAAICSARLSQAAVFGVCEMEPASGNKCLESCPTDSTELNLGPYGCVSGTLLKCCTVLETTTPETTTPTTPEATTTTTPETTTTTTPAATTTTTPAATTTTQPPTTIQPPTTTQPPTTIPIEEQCGLRAGSPGMRIMGGQDATPCDWPWQVSIRGRVSPNSTLDPTSSNTKHFCSGVIIADQWVVTTAYCALSASSLGGSDPVGNLLVVTGDHDVTDLVFDVNAGTIAEGLYGVSDYELYNGYIYGQTPFTFDNNEEAESNNIILLKLSRMIEFGDCVRKACPPEGLDATGGQKNCKIASWGSNGVIPTVPILQEADVQLIDRDVLALVNSFIGINEPIKPLTTMAKFTGGAGNTCPGDSGGMVICEDTEGKWALEGLINIPRFGTCVEANQFLVTDVAAASEWISTTTV